MIKKTEIKTRGPRRLDMDSEKRIHDTWSESRKWKVKIKRITSRPPHKVT